MISTTRKDSKESLESMLRRFGRKVQQSGTLATAKQSMYFERPITKRERRLKAIVRRQRKNLKARKYKLTVR